MEEEGVEGFPWEAERHGPLSMGLSGNCESSDLKSVRIAHEDFVICK